MSMLGRLSDRLRHSVERRTMSASRARAHRGEDLAHRHLQKRGYKVVARNYRTLAGNEIDLIAWHGSQLVFVEVKTRASDDAGTPERAVTPEKEQRIVKAARNYAQRANVDWDKVRFDVVAVTDGARPVIELYPDAFGAAASL